MGVAFYYQICMLLITLPFIYNCRWMGGGEMKLKLYLADGKTIFMEDTLENFKKEYLDKSGNYKVGYFEIMLKDMKKDPTTVIFTKHIVAIEEIKS